MKQILRSKISKVSSYLEIALSVIVLVGIAIMSVQLIKDIVIIIRSISGASIADSFETFMGDALKLIIGIEFVKMLLKHTPESVVEVLLFAIARKLIIGTLSSFDIIVGIGSIAVLFIVRCFLLNKEEKEIISKQEGKVVSELEYTTSDL